MSRTVLPFAVADITALARSLRGQLAQQETTPGHLTLLNMLARAAGCKNFQHFRVQVGTDIGRQAAPVAVAATAPPAPDALDARSLNRLLRYFDTTGQLVRWPSKYSHRLLCLWPLWAALPARQTFDEYGITAWLEARHTFGDAALLRRLLCDHGMMRRSRDCRAYQRVECRPSAEGLALIRAVAARQKMVMA